jgi:membrane peptidoglycan carboxypeptidase
MLQGAAYSVNTYFMALEQKTTQCAAADAAESLGLRRGDGSALQRNPTFTLGTDEVTPLGMATAYAAFANHGTYCQNVAILRVTDRNNKDLAIPQAGCKRVMDRTVADSVTSVLSQVIDGPLPGRTGATMSLGRDAAGKTGTINQSAAVWFVGFTPDLAAAVATYDPRGGYGYPMQNITIAGHYYAQVFGRSIPGPIWKQAMLGALASTPKTPFDLTPLDGLGTYVPPVPGACPSATPVPGATSTASPCGQTSPTPGASGSPTPGGSPSPTPKPSPSTKPTPKPSTSPTPKPTTTR